MVKIRLATIEDEDRVIDLFGQFPSRQSPSSQSPDKWPEAGPTFREITRNGGIGTVLVAELGGDLVGVIALSYPTSMRCGGIYTCIEELIVSEKARGEGVGGQLLQAAIAEANSRGCYEIQVNNPSEAGYPVYLRYGLEDVGKHLKMQLSPPMATDQA